MCGSPIISLWAGSARWQNKRQHLQSDWYDSNGGESRSDRSGCLQSRWTRHCPAACPQPGLNWIKMADAGSGQSRDVRHKGHQYTPVKGEEVYRGWRRTCRAALYSICSLRGAWRPWMFLSVDKPILSLFSWYCKPNAQMSFVIVWCLNINNQMLTI